METRLASVTGQTLPPTLAATRQGCAESDENFGYWFSKNRTEPTSKFKNGELGFRGSFFRKLTLAVWGRFFTLSYLQFILIFLHAISVHF